MTSWHTAVETAHDGGVADPAPLPFPLLPFAQIAFAGHNQAEDLGDLAALAKDLQAVWAILAEAGIVEARLLTGFGGRADALAVESWRASGLGPVHTVLPFLDDDDAGNLPDDLSQTTTRLDGMATRAIQRSPHLAQTRWIIGAADLLVAVWTGGPARGPGGTADAVRLALEHGVPVLWVSPGGGFGPRLIRPEFLFEDSGFLEFLDQLATCTAPLVRDATTRNLHDALLDLGLADEGESGSGVDQSGGDATWLAWPWRAYSIFRRLLGGRAEPFVRGPIPDDLVGQPGFVRLSNARTAAADEARRLGAVHRSQQVILLGIAITMATVGSAPSLWPDYKLELVAVELMLAVIALAVWLSSERRERHLRWAEARKRAEDLRLERAAWALGVSTVPHGLAESTVKEARQARRLAGLPQGAFDAVRVRAWGAWAVEELLSGQAAYHRSQATINGRISHRVHQVENISFVVLLVLLLSYIGASIGMGLAGAKTPYWLAGVVFMSSAIVPAIGAAGLALEATLSLGEQAHRSRVLSGRLEALKAKLGSSWGLEDLQATARTAIRLQRAQEDHWSEDVGRRRLFRGG